MLKNQDSKDTLNKIGFSAVAAASLMEILKRQRDAVGLSIYSDTYEYYAPEKGSERHRKHVITSVGAVVSFRSQKQQQKLINICMRLQKNYTRRSLIFLFTDMFQTT